MIDFICIQGNKVDKDLAKRLAAQFECEITENLQVQELQKAHENQKDAAYFLLDKTGLSFVAGNMTLKGDFSKLLSRVNHIQQEILLKAAGMTSGNAGASGSLLKAVDATAGLGEDSFILAAGGFEVELFEHNPVTAALLSDALIRARKDPALKEIAKRMHLTVGDSKELLSKLSYEPDLIYLDPMFPEKKGSAESKKKLQMLHKIESPCSDENELLKAAMDAGPKKIVIKRPPDGPFLGGVKPTYQIIRKAVRFDCINFR